MSAILLLFQLLISDPLIAEERRDYNILIVKSEFKLYLYHLDSLVKTYPICIGKNEGDKEKVGDCKTPEGNFYISAIQDSRNWTHDFKDGKGVIHGAYGPWFLRLNTGKETTKSGKRWTGIAIHGTHDETSIGTKASEGCVRMLNQNIDEVKNYVQLRTKVIIKE